MTQTKRDVLLVVSSDERERVIEAVDEVLDEHRHHTRDGEVWDAAYRLACAGYDAEGIETLLTTVVRYSVEFGIDAGRLADRVAKVINIYDIDEEHADELLERARTLAVQKSMTVDDIFDVLERLGPTLRVA